MCIARPVGAIPRKGVARPRHSKSVPMARFGSQRQGNFCGARVSQWPCFVRFLGGWLPGPHFGARRWWRVWPGPIPGELQGLCMSHAALLSQAFGNQCHGDLALMELLPMSLEVVQYIVSFRGAFGLGPGSQGTTSPLHISCGLALSANGTGTSQGVVRRQWIWLVLWVPQLLRRV